MEPFVGLTQLLTTQVCTWKDIVEYVTLVHNDVLAMKPSRGLGQRLRMAAIGGSGVEHGAWFVACELARAYNGLLAQGGHNIALDSPGLPMKHLIECKELRPDYLPVESVGGAGWSAHVPSGGAVKYPAVMLGHVRQDGIGKRVTLRMHRFVCWLAHGPATAPDHEVCHACNHTACVRPSHLRWGSRSQNVRERVKRKRRR